jgi:hypothetical protein
MLSDTESLQIRIGQLKIAVRPGNTSPANVFYYLPVRIRLLKFSIGADLIIDIIVV